MSKRKIFVWPERVDLNKLMGEQFGQDMDNLVFKDMYLGTFAASGSEPKPLTLETLKDCLDMMEREFPREMSQSRNRDRLRKLYNLNFDFDYFKGIDLSDWIKK